MAIQSESPEAATHWMSPLSASFACIDRQLLSSVSWCLCRAGADCWRSAAPHSASLLAPPAPSSSAPSSCHGDGALCTVGGSSSRLGACARLPSQQQPASLPQECASHAEPPGLRHRGREQKRRAVGGRCLFVAVQERAELTGTPSPSLVFTIIDHTISIKVELMFFSRMGRNPTPLQSIISRPYPRCRVSSVCCSLSATKEILHREIRDAWHSKTFLQSPRKHKTFFFFFGKMWKLNWKYHVAAALPR